MNQTRWLTKTSETLQARHTRPVTEYSCPFVSLRSPGLMIRGVLAVAVLLLVSVPAFAQSTGQVRGRITDETGVALPGVSVELRGSNGQPVETVTDGTGDYAFDGVAPGTYQLNYNLINFGSVTHRDLKVTAGATATNNEV